MQAPPRRAALPRRLGARPRGGGLAVDPADAARARQRCAAHPRTTNCSARKSAWPTGKEYNNGEPERHGDERNYQKYLDRVAEMKAAIARKESDVAAIRREIAKLPP